MGLSTGCFLLSNDAISSRQDQFVRRRVFVELRVILLNKFQVYHLIKDSVLIPTLVTVWFQFIDYTVCIDLAIRKYLIWFLFETAYI